MHARDIMTTPVIAVTPSVPLPEAGELMARHGFTALPVVDSSGRLLGLLTEEDVVRAGIPGDADPDAGAMISGHRTAGAVMRRPALGAAADLECGELARRMTEAGIRSLPVLDDGVLVGMVTLRDVLRVLPAAGAS
ncbi:CBS domain-containing protein [Amycolatopsis dendrobii]|uniref:CBS domain-containing protein n=1 Tax=Amycolatopsis dendrobii TaxID=2760662 RepID=A0A7W3Z8K0_9PSEU|nr:CBS domain-containing protein [Amycolatopsis dendrobii]MBB1152280.1 CBS domain-containing protein [Amycolatopsis dendrobii]